MNYASPAVQLLGLVCSVLVCALAIFASVLLLREKSAGSRLMLVGSILALIGTAVPQSIYALENFVASYSSSLAEHDTYYVIHNLMYYSIWDWLSTASWMLFSVGLLLVALRRRALAARITELENILSQSAPPDGRSATPPPHLHH